MTITNFKDKYIKIESKYLDQLLVSPSDFSKLEVTGAIGCDNTPVTESIISSAINNAGWVIDLSEPVGLNNSIYQLFVKNLYSLKQFNVITTPIDLAYVANTCTSPSNDCTLETYNTYFAPLFKTQIDAWFTSKSIVSNVTVTFSGNKLIITNVPANFGFSFVEYNSTNSLPYYELPFGYSGSTSNIVISDEAIYVSPKLFADTTLEDGIYNLTLKFTKINNGGFISESSCAFIDTTIRCKVATIISGLVDTDKTGDAESIILLHYGLTTGSNCGCNCEDLCKLFNELLSLLTNTVSNSNTIIPEDCGC